MAGGALLRSLNFNCGGASRGEIRLATRQLLRKLDTGVCVKTETRLRRSAANRITFREDKIVTKYCREGAGGKGGGGATAFVRKQVRADSAAVIRVKEGGI